MPYINASAALRPDLNAFVLEGSVDSNLLIGEKVLPVLTSDTKSGQYPIYKVASGETHKNATGIRARGGSYPRIVRAMDTGNFDCVDRGLEEPIDDVDIADMSRFMQLEVLSAKLCLGNVQLGHEIRVAEAIMNTGFTATNAAVNYTETLIATQDFARDVKGAISRLRAKGIEPNAFVMGGTLWDMIVRGTKLQNFMRGSGKSDSSIQYYSSDVVAQVLGLQMGLVGRGYYDANAKGKTNGTLTEIWGTTYFWVGQVSGGGLVSNGMVAGAIQGAGRTLVWNKEGGLYVTETYREENKRSDIVRVRQNTAEKVFNYGAGELITTSYSAS